MILGTLGIRAYATRIIHHLKAGLKIRCHEKYTGHRGCGLLLQQKVAYRCRRRRRRRLLLFFFAAAAGDFTIVATTSSEKHQQAYSTTADDVAVVWSVGSTTN